jgi:hypothetical protein
MPNKDRSTTLPCASTTCPSATGCTGHTRAISHSFGGISPVLTGQLITALREIIW